MGGSAEHVAEGGGEAAPDGHVLVVEEADVPLAHLVRDVARAPEHLRAHNPRDGGPPRKASSREQRLTLGMKSKVLGTPESSSVVTLCWLYSFIPVL